MKSRIGMTMMIGRLAASVLFSLLLSAGIAHAGRQQPITVNLTAPKAVALDARENLYVVESATNRLHMFNAAGEYIRSLSNLDRPVCVAVDGQGRIYVGNGGRKNVEVYGQDFNLLFKLGAGDGEFSLPGAVAADSSGRVYVADSKTDRINVYNPDGSFRFSFGSSGSQSGRFHFPTAVAVDDAAQELYITDLPQMQTRDGLAEGARIQVFTLRGVYKRGFGTYGQGDGLLTRPAGVAVDGAGRVYITDSYQNVVEVFDGAGQFVTTLYDLANPMRNPLGVAVSGSGRVFISSINTGKVEVYSVPQ
ncbi:MAG TPA: NHL repeat-containing protein [Nitrospirota bacterium]|nr:NHL repeat-containing protein [Nitrospirota bacterium]